MRLFNPDRLFYSRASRGPASTDRDQSTMNLYCWRCNGPHVLLLTDVERLVYVLGASERDAWDDAHMPSGREHPECLLEVLGWANDADCYAEHVEQGIECRERAE